MRLLTPSHAGLDPVAALSDKLSTLDPAATQQEAAPPADAPAPVVEGVGEGAVFEEVVEVVDEKGKSGGPCCCER